MHTYNMQLLLLQVARECCKHAISICTHPHACCVKYTKSLACTNIYNDTTPAIIASLIMYTLYRLICVFLPYRIIGLKLSRLPFDRLLQWDEFSIRLPEHRLGELPAILQAIPDETIIKMQKEVVRVYEAYFSR